jgi:hypothetical protein
MNNNPVTKQELIDALLMNNQILRGFIKEDTKIIVDEAVRELAEMVKGGFDEVDEKFEGVNLKLDKIEARLDRVEDKVGIKKILFS